LSRGADATPDIETGIQELLRGNNEKSAAFRSVFGEALQNSPGSGRRKPRLSIALSP
jgi:hypothetical protein